MNAGGLVVIRSIKSGSSFLLLRKFRKMESRPFRSGGDIKSKTLLCSGMVFWEFLKEPGRGARVGSGLDVGVGIAQEQRLTGVASQVVALLSSLNGTPTHSNNNLCKQRHNETNTLVPLDDTS